MPAHSDLPYYPDAGHSADQAHLIVCSCYLLVILGWLDLKPGLRAFWMEQGSLILYLLSIYIIIHYEDNDPNYVLSVHPYPQNS